MKALYYFLTLWFLTYCLLAHGQQNNKQLNAQKNELLFELEQTKKLLRSTSNHKAAALDNYITLNTKIQKTNSLIESIKSQMDLTSQSISRTQIAIEALSSDIITLTNSYGKITRALYRHYLTKNYYLYILSSSSINQAIRRYVYLKQISKYRKDQALAIKKTTQSLTTKKKNLREKINLNEVRLNEIHTQQLELSEDLIESEKLLSSIKRNERKLKITQKKQEKRQKKIESTIASIIADYQVQPENHNIIPKSNSTLLEKEHGKPFKVMKGKLNMPVQGVITRKFGKQEHPTIKNLIIDSPSIIIRTENKAPIKSIYEGSVRAVIPFEHINHMIIIEHKENYYSTYTNVIDPRVQVNQKVKTNQLIGHTGFDKLAHSSNLHLELWHYKTKLNPHIWLK